MSRPFCFCSHIDRETIIRQSLKWKKVPGVVKRPRRLRKYVPRMMLINKLVRPKPINIDIIRVGIGQPNKPVCVILRTLNRVRDGLNIQSNPNG